MSETNWIQISSGILGGGAAGAIITNIVSHLKAKKTCVEVTRNLTKVFSATASPKEFEAKIIVGSKKHKSLSVTFLNLYFLDLSIKNAGSKDYESIKFGISLRNGDKCVFSESSGCDRHHNAIIESEIDVCEPAEIIDYTVSPFNRNEEYKFRIYITIPDEKEKPDNVSLSSPAPVVFKEATRAGFDFLKLIELTSISLMGAHIRINNPKANSDL